MAAYPSYSYPELCDLRDGLDEILNYLDKHPVTVDGEVGSFESNRQLRPTGFTLHVKFGKGAQLPIMPPPGGVRSVFNLANIGFNPQLLSQVLNQLIATMEAEQ